MLDEECKDQLHKYRFDALATKHLHHIKLSRKRRLSLLIDFLAIGVPVFYFAIRFAAKGTEEQLMVETVWEFLAATLTVLTIMKMCFRWDHSIERHTKLMEKNNWLASKAQKILALSATMSRREYEQFVESATELENEDRGALSYIAAKERQLAYREALKEIGIKRGGGMSSLP